MTIRVEVQPQLLEWARARSGIDEATWTKRFPLFDKWVAGEQVPTLKQLEDFARKTYTPVGYFYLDEPPQETVPIDDFRTMRDRPVSPVGRADLLDTLYACQARQEWYHHHQLLNDESPLSFIGKATVDTPPVEVANDMRVRLKWGTLSLRWVNIYDEWDVALARLRDSAENSGVLVMISSIVGSNTRRRLDPELFRGFALFDPYAPLVFVNGAESKAQQLFTLAHELAHLWLGSSALSDLEPESMQKFDIEHWCNQVAVKLLVSEYDLDVLYGSHMEEREYPQPPDEPFHASTWDILSRIRQVKKESESEVYLDRFTNKYRLGYHRAYESKRMSEVPDYCIGDADRYQWLMTDIAQEQRASGKFFNTTLQQVGKLFAHALIASTLEGRTSYTKAFDLLAVKSASTFDRLAKELDILHPGEELGGHIGGILA